MKHLPQGQREALQASHGSRALMAAILGLTPAAFTATYHLTSDEFEAVMNALYEPLTPAQLLQCVIVLEWPDPRRAGEPRSAHLDQGQHRG